MDLKQCRFIEKGKGCFLKLKNEHQIFTCKKGRIFFLSNDLNMVLAPCKLMQIREIMLDHYISSGLPYFYGKIGGYVVIYRCKDKNTTQGKLAELVGSPVVPLWYK